MNDLKSRIIRHEGLCLRPYTDSVGKLTIGVGRNLDDVGITSEEAFFLLDNDIKKATNQASTFAWFSSLSDQRKNVIIEMLFNMGMNSFLEFKGMIGALEKNDYSLASKEMLDSKWAKQVGDRAIELSKFMVAPD